jgi:photosystem II stability/assembly factor-like uncharacterized protein
MRNIGPFRSSGWITTIAVPSAPAHDHLYTIWVGSRSGGVWKTTNGGATWDPVFDSTGVAPIGAITVAPSDANIVWVGTGDQANARSSYSGRGVFKSTDGGATWAFMGLPDSHHIARIVIHPKDPNIVYVAAMGHLFSTNEERGVFKTTDGGKTWKKVLYVNDRTGAIDLVLNEKNPATLYAAMYDKQRLPWRLIEGGPETAVYRTTDAGATWQRLGGGLPTGNLGRIGLDIYTKNPNILYALVENVNAAGERGGAGRGGTSIVGNELYRTDDAGKTWTKTTDVNVADGKAPYSFNQIRVDPGNDKRVIVNSDVMTVSEDAGKTWDDRRIWPNGFFRRAFGDFRTMWFDPDDPQRILIGSDGGLQFSFDGGKTSDFFPNLKIGEAYAVGVDMDDPYNVYAGFQDHDSWKGPSNGRWGVISVDDWVTVGPGDGMYNVVDPTDSRWVYNTRELNQLGRMDQRTGVRADIRPPQLPGTPRLRYNWIAPIALSPFDPKTLYAGAQMLFRSKDRGDHWEAISPDLTTNDTTKIGFPSTPYCTITSISESPVSPGVIWIGTDDGHVQLTRDAGATWTNLTPALTAAGAPAERWVSRVFASPHRVDVAFVSKTGFRNDDFTPYLYRTADGGKTWQSISGDLPHSPVNVVVQDRTNAHLLVVGNDLGVYVSIDDGQHWSRFKANLPTVAVHDLLIHPRENDLVLATYGRALWVGDVSPLRELTPEVLAKNAHLFDVESKPRYGFGTQGMNYRLFGDRYLQVPNEPEGLTVNYYVKTVGDSAQITIADASGRVVRQMSGPAVRGLNRVFVSFVGGGGRGAGGGGRGGGGAATVPLGVGDYVVTLDVAGQKLTKPAVVRGRIQ